MYRRSLVKGGLSAAALMACSPPVPVVVERFPGDKATELTRLFDQAIGDQHIPGLSACLIDRESILWQYSAGFANIATQEPNTRDHLQNIASISKTFTTLAAMQQVEAGKLALDSDLNDYLPFVLRNPCYPGHAITLRMLMEHSSSLQDGEVYAHKYACGDPGMSLKDWVHACFEPGGDYYDADQFFATWQPGAQNSYCNVSFGLMAYLVELASGEPFPSYCREKIFIPLGMTDTSWMLADIDLSRHVVPYSWVENVEVRGPSWGGVPLGVIREDGPTQNMEDGFQANCAYNHPNYPDGFLRTSVNQLVTWARLWLNDGIVNEQRLLQSDTVNAMFTQGRFPDQGLTWHRYGILSGSEVWGHSGGDPGVNTDLSLVREKGLAAIVFINTDGVDPGSFTRKILRAALATGH